MHAEAVPHKNTRRPTTGEQDTARKFGNCMSTGRVNEALRILSESEAEPRSGVLQLDEVITLKDGETMSVKDLLVEKHPSKHSASAVTLIGGECPQVNTIRFEGFTPALLQQVAKECRGSTGPSGLDSDAWRRLCSSCKGASTAICQALACFA